MERYEGKYLLMEFLEEKKLLKSSWNTQSYYMQDDDFKVEILETLAMIGKCKPTHLLVNAENFDFQITPDKQDWIITNITQVQPPLTTYLRKIALIQSKSISAQVSVQQTLDELSLPMTDFSFFKTEKEALDWLFG